MATDTPAFAALPIPTSDGSWRHCSEVKCGIPLAPGYLEGRIRVLADPGQEQTRRCARTDGQDHLDRVLGRFRQAQAARAGSPTDR